jgi:hypothetical protein
MASLINRYFSQNKSNEQAVLNGLVQESIQIQGRVYQYMPRNAQVTDLILGEDVISSFNVAIPIECYMVDAQGFQGQREMFSKFGLQINNSYRLVVSVDRWNKEVKTQFDGNVNTGEASFTVANYVRPHEGDLIYDSLTKFLMVIKFVDHDMEFYSLGRNYVYYLTCEAFMYNNEDIATNVPAIDAFNAGLTMDVLQIAAIETEDGFLLGQEDGWALLMENEPAPTRNANVDFVTPAKTVNTTVSNPFNI